MPEDSGPVDAERSASPENGSGDPGERLRPLATRRDFLVGAGAGAVVVGVVAGGTVVATRGGQPTQAVPTGPGGPAVAVAPAPAQQIQPAPQQQQQQQPQQQQQQAASQLPATHRRVTLNIDGLTHDVTVDVRESLWETMTQKLGLANSNLGCDRAQCGACAIVVDGRAVNGCTVLTARLGRGQKILTVAGISKGPGLEGLHPVQRAFWEDGGFQCGICTRGFIMSTYALLQTTPSPTDDQIREGLAGNICRCGEYVKIYTSVHNAAAMMAGQQVNSIAPASALMPPLPAQPQAANAATAAQPAAGTSKDFEFQTPLATIEEFEPLASPLKEKPGILEVGGSERTITVKWDPTKIDEAGVRKALTDSGHPVK
jgi:aerobic-type carbon monoxide dehydrogenase small subunit (CoxS/CutS family)